MPRHLRSQTSNTSSISAATAGCPRGRTAGAYWFSTSAPPRLELPHRAQHALEQVERLEAR